MLKQILCGPEGKIAVTNITGEGGICWLTQIQANLIHPE